MATMGRYCKAYSISRMQEFGDWSKKARLITSGNSSGDSSKDGSRGDGVLVEGKYLYLQEDYTVTSGIYLDEGLIFDNITPEWIEFCKGALKFEIPADLLMSDTTSGVRERSDLDSD
jgi:hypothetical protein